MLILIECQLFTYEALSFHPIAPNRHPELFTRLLHPDDEREVWEATQRDVGEGHAYQRRTYKMVRSILVGTRKFGKISFF